MQSVQSGLRFILPVRVTAALWRWIGSLEIYRPSFRAPLFPLGWTYSSASSLWGVLGSLLGALGSLWASTWLPLGCPWVPLGRPWVPLGRPWHPLKYIPQFCQNWRSNSEHLALKSAACPQNMISRGSSADSALSRGNDPNRTGPGPGSTRAGGQDEGSLHKPSQIMPI